jgi:DNA recombination protein RmuC
MRSRILQLETEKESGDSATARMQQTFQAVADAALRSNQSAFLDAARSTFLERQTAIEGVVKPLSETLEKLDGQFRQIEKERAASLGGLDRQLQVLVRETGTLSNALKSPQARGRWGEITLRRVAEIAGMSPHCDFSEQLTLGGEINRQRPDMTVRMPGGRQLAVDSKAPLSAYLDAVAATDEATQKAALRRHSQQVVAHAEKLGAKQYWNQFQPAPELVILFLPGDHFLSAALEYAPGLIEQAMEKKVVLATPATLISILLGVSYGWREEKLALNAAEIRQAAQELCLRLEGVQEHYVEAGRQLGKSVDAYNKSVGSWETRLLPMLRRIRELGIPGPTVAAMEMVDKALRAPRELDREGDPKTVMGMKR